MSQDQRGIECKTIGEFIDCSDINIGQSPMNDFYLAAGMIFLWAIVCIALTYKMDSLIKTLLLFITPIILIVSAFYLLTL